MVHEEPRKQRFCVPQQPEDQIMESLERLQLQDDELVLPTGSYFWVCFLSSSLQHV